ncbi:MAG: cell surface protein SprA, partial [Saprospiraceae bacterium]
PQYDPYDLDIELKDKLANADTPEEKAVIKEQAQTVTEIKSYNFTNVRKERTNPDKKPMPWDIANFSFTYAYDETTRRDPIIENDVLTRRRGAIDYTFSRQVKYIEPLKKVVKDDKYLKFLKDFNFNPLPNSFSFSTDLDRRFNTTKYRFAGTNPLYNTFYNKQFLWNRIYDLQWDLTKSLRLQFNANNEGVIDEPDETQMLQRSALPITDPLYISDIGQYRRDSIWGNIRNFGRTKTYQHNLNVTYTLPFKKLPFMDWMNMKASYRSTYGWDAASQAPSSRSLGNIIRNGQSRQIGGDMDFEKLYNYSPYLKSINSKRRSRSGRGSRGNTSKNRSRNLGKSNGKGGDTLGGPGRKNGKNAPDSPDAIGNNKNRKNRRGGRNNVDSPGGPGNQNGKAGGRSRPPKKKNTGPSTMERAFVRPLMLVRKLKLNYKEEFSTVVPGYLPSSQLFGMHSFDSPGWGFVAGLQPNINQSSYYSKDDWLYSNWNWITGDQLLNQPVTQNYKQQMDGKLTLEPFSGFRIDVEASRSRTENHSEFFRRDEIFGDPNDRFQEEFKHLIPSDFGSFTVSYSALKTLFNDDLTGLFHSFEDNRVIVANRIGSGPPGSHDNEEDANLGFPRGYGRYQQNVLVPAFLASYTG